MDGSGAAQNAQRSPITSSPHQGQTSRRTEATSWYSTETSGMAATNSVSFPVPHHSAESPGSGTSVTLPTRQCAGSVRVTQSEVSLPCATVSSVANCGPVSPGPASPAPESRTVSQVGAASTAKRAPGTHDRACAAASAGTRPGFTAEPSTAPAYR
ncbi:hypothetical protein STAL104432_32605 [Streptomyces albus]